MKSIIIMNTMKSPLFLVGPKRANDEEPYLDDPDYVNRNLFHWEGKWLTLPGSEGHHPKLLRIEVADTPQWAAFGTRMLLPLRVLSLPDEDTLRVSYQPFYQSSGVATPFDSPKGTWWPCSGLFTRAYCDSVGLAPKYVGHIGKHYRQNSVWINHEKNVKRVPPQLLQVAEWLQAAIPERKIKS